MTDPIDPSARRQWAESAQQIARLAGAEIQTVRSLGEVQLSRKRFDELVTSADLASDRLIRAAIGSRYPQHRILTEETMTGSIEDIDFDGPLWIVDPLDGTVNFAYGLPLFAVSIAFAWDGLVQAGAVYVPDLDLMYAAARDMGATCNGAAIHVGNPGSLVESLVSTGLPYDRSRTEAAIARAAKLSRHCRDIRRQGAAALDICFVASGRLDAHVETLAPWDFAAAGLIAREAGAALAHVGDVPAGRPAELYGEEVVFAAPSIADGLLRLLRTEGD